MSASPFSFARRTARLFAAVLVCCLALPPLAAGAQSDEDQPGPGLPPSPNAPATSDEGEAGWAVQPAGPDGPGLRSAFTYNVEPGQTLRDSVSISNLSTEAITFAIYAKDAFNTAIDGAFALQDDAEEPVGVGSWLNIQVGEYTVPSGRRADIPFEMVVPDDASPGDHVGGIIAANVDVVDEVERDGVMLAIRQRVAARIYVRVAGPLTPELQITDIDVDTTRGVIPFVQGRGTITYTVENVGNVRLETATESEVTGLFGRTVSSLDSQDLPELLPGGSVQVTESWEGNPPLERLNAKITLRTLDTELSETASTRFFVWSWAVPILIGLVALAFGIRAWRRRRSDDGDDAEADGGSDDLSPADDAAPVEA